MAGNLNLTPQALSSIISTMDKMKDSLNSEASQLERDTMSIKSMWNDVQYEAFESTIIMFNSNLKAMADRLEVEKQRIIRFQRDANMTQQNFGNP